jgi:hypothetical protein
MTGWHGSYITKIIRSRVVLGETEIGKYEEKTVTEIIDGKREEYIQVKRKPQKKWVKVYPVIESITEAQWERSNAALDARKNGRGPKGEDFANLFQGIAKCAHCSGSMKLISTAKMKRGNAKRYHYYRCANSRRNECSGNNTLSYDYAKVEREFLAVFQGIVDAYLYQAENEKVTPIKEKLAEKRNELYKLIERTKLILGEITRLDVTEDIKARLSEGAGIEAKKSALEMEIGELEREDRLAQSLVPAEDVAQETHELVEALADEKDQFQAREKINAQLRRFIWRITFDREGMISVLYAGRDGKQLGPAKSRTFSKYPPEYRMRLNPDGSFEREHPFYLLRRSAAMGSAERQEAAAVLPAADQTGEDVQPVRKRPDPFSVGLRGLRKRVRPTDKTDSYENVLKGKRRE